MVKFQVESHFNFLGFMGVFFSVIALIALLTFAMYAHSERAYLQRNVALFIAVCLVLLNMWNLFRSLVRDFKNNKEKIKSWKEPKYEYI